MTVSLENAVLEEYAKFDGFKELLEDDMLEPDPDNDVFANIKENQAELKKQYLNIKVAQAKYKNKVVSAAVTESVFNSEDSSYKYNDVWMSNVKKEYQRVHKNASSFLKKEHATEEAKFESNTIAVAADEVANLSRKIKLEIQQAEIAVNDTMTNLTESQQINYSQAQVYTDLKLELMNVVDLKLPALLKSLNEAAGPNHKDEVDKLNKLFTSFEAKLKPKLYNLVHLIAEKVSHVASTTSDTVKLPGKAEVVHLKKIDPPSFSGKEEDFPEFQRKWLAIVGPARLPAEAEIDRLREAIPIEARDMLTGITNLSTAWDILKKRFGDEDLIAIKLKNELKSLIINAKQDHEKIISLAIKVRSLVTRLDQLKASKALKYDGEFVAAIYFQLPCRHQQEWLKFDKGCYKDKWSALMAFLEESYEKAVQEKLLLASLNSNEPKKGAISGLAATVKEDSHQSADDSDDKEDHRQQKYEEARQKAGKCPLCKLNILLKQDGPIRHGHQIDLLLAKSFLICHQNRKLRLLKRCLVAPVVLVGPIIRSSVCLPLLTVKKLSMVHNATKIIPR